GTRFSSRENLVPGITLFRHAVQAGLTSLWVMPGTRFSHVVGLFDEETTDFARKPGARHHPQRSKTSLHCVPEQGAPIAHLRWKRDRLRRSLSTHRTNQNEMRVRKHP